MGKLRIAQAIAVGGAILALSGCAGGNYRPVSDTPVRIGRPYTVRGQTFVPAADPTYDMLGYASWYGPESGNKTANGERFRPDWITAAHTTLPLPTYVEVISRAARRRSLVSRRSVMLRCVFASPTLRKRIGTAYAMASQRPSCRPCPNPPSRTYARS